LKIGLFIPCYVDQFYPEVGLATLEVLEHLGCDVEFPIAQTCCGQPMANTGCLDAARPLVERFLQTFESYDYVVAPSGSCVAMVRHHFAHVSGDSPRVAAMAERTFEFCEFLVDVLNVSGWEGEFPRRVGLHQACHGLRELRLGQPSEVVSPPFNKVAQLLQGLAGIELVELDRVDECCGFGGTFAVSEEAVSVQMGRDRLADHVTSKSDVVVAADMSCLMHLQGLSTRQQIPLNFMHVAQVLVASGGAPCKKNS
jgi:L-lactate dehydrogenase complex protein LldE